MLKSPNVWLLILILALSGLTACSGSNGNAFIGPRGGGGGGSTSQAQLSPPDQSTISGQCELPVGFPIPNSELILRSLVGVAQLDAIGNFSSLRVLDQGIGQILFLEHVSGTPIAVVYLSNEQVRAGLLYCGVEDFALGLVKLNPYVMLLTDDMQEVLFHSVVAHPEFATLVTGIRNALENAPLNALNYDAYPYLFRLAIQIGIETIDDLSLFQFGIIGNFDQPHLDDVPGGATLVVNPTQVFYGVDFGNGEDTVIKGRGGIFDTDITSWSPWDFSPFTEPTVESHFLADGEYRIIFYKGFNIREPNWFSPANAAGKATLANTLKITSMVFNSIGLIPGGELFSAINLNDERIELLVNSDDIPTMDLGELGLAINDAVDWQRLIFDVLPLFLEEHWEEIAEWLWESATPWTTDPDLYLNIASFMSNLATILPAISQAFTVFEWGNEYIPFLIDMVFAPPMLEYYVRRSNGTLSEISSLIPPTAHFTASNTNPDVGENVNLDASSSFDDADPTSALEIRWDFDGNQIWDTSWTTSKFTTTSYSTRGPFRPVVEVRDLDGQTARFGLDLVVGSSDQIKIVLTWGISPTDLDSHLFTPNIQGATYHVYYASRGSLSAPPYAWLDVDDVSSYGPETIWIDRFFPGTYTYDVYNFSGSPALTVSNAHVEVILTTGGLLASFDVPVSGSGRWWNVFELDGATGAITPINTISDSSLRGTKGMEDKEVPN